MTKVTKAPRDAVAGACDRGAARSEDREPERRRHQPALTAGSLSSNTREHPLQRSPRGTQRETRRKGTDAETRGMVTVRDSIGSAGRPMVVFGGCQTSRMERPLDQILGRAVTLEEVAQQHPEASSPPHTRWPLETRLTYFGRSTGDFTLKDAWTLRKGEWLQGIVIDCYIRAQNRSRSTVPFFHFNNTFYEKLRSRPRGERDICLETVRAWGLGQDWEGLALLTFVVPIPDHWTLIVADLRTSPKTLSAYDSLYHMNKGAVRRMGYIRHYL